MRYISETDVDNGCDVVTSETASYFVTDEFAAELGLNPSPPCHRQLVEAVVEIFARCVGERPLGFTMGWTPAKGAR